MSIDIDITHQYETHDEYEVTFFDDVILTTVTETPSVVDDWISTVEYIHRRRLHRLVVGLDVEWRPNFIRRCINPVATLQLCVGRRCLIFQILHASYIPDSLTDFLGDDDYTFVGVGIKNDVQKLADDYDLEVSCTVDLADYSDRRNVGLKDLAYEILDVDFVKPRSVTLSNWDNRFLNFAQTLNICKMHFLSDKLQVQIQIKYHKQKPGAIVATLHHQMIYRFQDHACDLHLPNHTEDTLMIKTEANSEATIINIPKQIPKDDLLQIMPLEWLTDYEKKFEQPRPVHTTEAPTLVTQSNGSIKTVFKRPGQAGPSIQRTMSSPFSSFLAINMMQPGASSDSHVLHITADMKRKSKREKIPIHAIFPDASIAYVSRVNGHFVWDADPSMCEKDCTCYEDEEIQIPRSQKCHCSSYKHPKPDQDPDPDQAAAKRGKEKLRKAKIDLLAFEAKMLLRHEEQRDQKRKELLDSYKTYSQPTSINMMQPTSPPGDEEFPPLQRRIDPTGRIPASPFVAATTVSAHGAMNISPSEEVLNWQSQNARIQNQYLKTIDSRLENISSTSQSLHSKVDGFTNQIIQLHQQLSLRIDQLDKELRRFSARDFYSPEFADKEMELKQLKQQVLQIEEDMAKKKQNETIYGAYFPSSILTPPIETPTTYSYPSQGDYSKYYQMTSDIFKKSPKPKPKPRLPNPPKNRPSPSYSKVLSQPQTGSLGISFRQPLRESSPEEPSLRKDKQVQSLNMVQQTEPLASDSESPESSETNMSATTSETNETSYADITAVSNLFMVDQNPDDNSRVEDPPEEENEEETSQPTHAPRTNHSNTPKHGP